MYAIRSYYAGKSFRKIFDQYLPGWAIEPELLAKVEIIPDREIWQAHVEQKKALLDFANKAANATLNVDVFTLGFARRATEYKRTTLLFSNLDRLRTISRKGKFRNNFVQHTLYEVIRSPNQEAKNNMLNGQALIGKDPPDFKVTKTIGLISDTHVPKRALKVPET